MSLAIARDHQTKTSIQLVNVDALGPDGFAPRQSTSLYSKTAGWVIHAWKNASNDDRLLRRYIFQTVEDYKTFVISPKKSLTDRNINDFFALFLRDIAQYWTETKVSFYRRICFHANFTLNFTV